jgi:hypothetical protein
MLNTANNGKNLTQLHQTTIVITHFLNIHLTDSFVAESEGSKVKPPVPPPSHH